MQKNPARAALLVFAGLSLSACGDTMFNDARHAMTPQQRYPIVVEPQVVDLALPASSAISEENRARIAEFAAAYRDGGMGSVSVTGGVGTRAAMGAAAEALAGYGVPRSRIVVNAQDGAAGSVTLSFVRQYASARQCGDFSENLNETFNNAPTPNFGCATQNNIARMAADPGHLETPAAFEAGDGARRAVVLEKWRQGQPTATQRTNEDRADVSDVE